MSPHTVEGDLHVYHKKKVVRRSTRIALSIGGAAVLMAVGVVGYLQYRSPPGPPFTVAVERLTPTCGTGWIVPQSPDQIDIAAFTKANSMLRGWQDWPDGSDGVAASALGAGGRVQLSLQGRSATQVVLTDMKVRVLERRPPMAGTLLSMGCGDQWAYRWLEVDLDKDPPKVIPTFQSEAYMPDSPTFERKPISFPYRVAESDAETFIVNTQTKYCDCSWVVDVYWSSAGESGVLTVDDHGTAFRTSSDKNAKDCTILDRLMCT